MSQSFPFRLSSVQAEGELHVSKWLKHAFLVDQHEMKQFLDALGPFFLIPAGGLLEKDSFFVSREQFLETYAHYLEWTKNQPSLPSQELRRFFSLIFTCSLDCLYATAVRDNRYLIKPILPVIMIQLHHFFISQQDHKIYSMVMSRESMGWGIQISYPQIYEDPRTHTYYKVDVSEAFPNTAVFKEMIRWLRQHTMPMPLQFSGQRFYAPFRIGKNCLPWISHHAGLQQKGIQIMQKEQKIS